MRIIVDLGNLGQGRHQINLSDKNVQLPTGVNVERIMPEVIEVYLSKKERKPVTGSSE